nr:MAG TPA: hypothetical protein [Caudoviricetes sp.]
MAHLSMVYKTMFHLQVMLVIVNHLKNLSGNQMQMLYYHRELN